MARKASGCASLSRKQVDIERCLVGSTPTLAAIWRDVRVADGPGPENRGLRNHSVGSNPTLSASPRGFILSLKTAYGERHPVNIVGVKVSTPVSGEA